MTSDKRFPINLDSIAGLVTGVLLISIALALFLGSQAGIRVTFDLSETDDIGPFETLTVHFSEPVDGLLAIERLSIQPEVSGSFRWEDEKTLQFIPREPFQPGIVYTLSASPGALTQSGGMLKKQRAWNFHIRSPLIVYLVAEEGKGRLWQVNPENGKAGPLTDETLSIFDFDVSYDGEFILFSAFNDQQGLDLWRVEREGGNPILLLQCGPDRCSAPAISFYDQRVAYVREAAGVTVDLQFGAPRIWMLNLETRENAPLYEDGQIIGYSPAWSPDGTRLSSFDALADEIRLLDLVTGNQLIIPSKLGTPVTWSGDGDTFVFTDMEINDYGIYTQIRQAKLLTSEIVSMFGDNDQQDYQYNSLAWSPSEDKLVIGLKFEVDNLSTSLWLMDPVTLGGQVIASQPDYTYNSPRWDPWGQALVFQQFKLKGTYKPEIGMWKPGLEEPLVVTEGIMPRWLP